MPAELENEASLVRSPQAGCTEYFGILVNRKTGDAHGLLAAVRAQARFGSHDGLPDDVEASIFSFGSPD